MCAVDKENKVIDYYKATESDLESKLTDAYSNNSFVFLDITEDNVEGEHIVEFKDERDEFYYCLNSYIYHKLSQYL